MNQLLERFIRYVKIDTQSDPNTGLHPSTAKQKDLSKLLLEELQALKVESFLDDYGYVYAKLPSNVDYETKALGLIAHVDTSFDAPGKNVSPRIIKNYDGSEIILNEKFSMSPSEFPSLSRVIGEDIIVTDGHTLLGADDKLGVAEIMEVVTYLSSHPDVKHGDIYVCFTPDEEIGEGADHFNHDYFKADFAFTADGSEVGGIEYENFNAASASLHFTGKSIHPGSAKNKMVNALHIAMHFHQMLPVFLNPAYTEHYEGFNHLSNLTGSVDEAKSHYIIRNHDQVLFHKQKKQFEEIASYLNQFYGYDAVSLTLNDSYYNMYDILKDHMYIVSLAKKAIQNTGITPFEDPIRGGTDGARLTFDGLPCPNLGTGGYQFHGRFEFASINQMQQAYHILLELIRLVSINDF